MFEHMRNNQKLMEKISYFLNDKGKLFVHIFSHEFYPFTYQNSKSTGAYFLYQQQNFLTAIMGMNGL